MAADGGCKTSSRSNLRWPCLARCAVALVVGVLAAVILIKAVSLILHPNKFHLRVSGKFLVERVAPDLFACRFYLQAENRRERAFMYYRNVTVRLINGSAPATERTIMELDLSSTVITLMQGQVQEYYFLEEPEWPLSNASVQALFSDEKKSQSIGDCTVELDGELTSGGDTYHASYDCAPVTVVRGSATESLPPSASGNDAARCIPTVFL